eukprot:CAMPEP_0116835838 /NCGR_PEP_ID=MMETSP0418-20121206/7762_1 /TAXON_ID=1158023 /ORGANISM="Astrosyne radiata, Strain 13vi08-1A" /LENGTH=241 /DNA_ID=CAMNT_0004465539 /DNA_START=3 /DNA_END=728 /DNA_ORIENTATION=+
MTPYVISNIADILDHDACSDAAMKLATKLLQGNQLKESPQPDAQTCGLAASAMSHNIRRQTAGVAMQLFRHTKQLQMPISGRFLNALFRCFGNDIMGALAAWKREVRPFISDTQPLRRRRRRRNIRQAYYGLLHVCGRALRPDLALRIVEVMKKEDVYHAGEEALLSYERGKRRRRGGMMYSVDQQYDMGGGFTFEFCEEALRSECKQGGSTCKKTRGQHENKRPPRTTKDEEPKLHLDLT